MEQGICEIERNLIAGNLLAGVGIMGGGNTHENFGSASALEAVFVTNNTIIGNDHGVTGVYNMTARKIYRSCQYCRQEYRRRLPRRL
jgi:hypothetical protein